MQSIQTAVLSIFAFLVSGQIASGSVIQYINKPLWQSAVNNDYRTINFTGFPAATIITTQYSNVGVTFTDGDDFINISAGFLNDGAGLDGNAFSTPDVISMDFGTLQHWIAADFRGTLACRLYQNGTLIFASSIEHGGGQPESFYGLVSDVGFNRAVLFRYTGIGVNIDDLFYNAAPAPSGFALLAVGTVFGRSRRRTR